MDRTEPTAAGGSQSSSKRGQHSASSIEAGIETSSGTAQRPPVVRLNHERFACRATQGAIRCKHTCSGALQGWMLIVW